MHWPKDGRPGSTRSPSILLHLRTKKEIGMTEDRWAASERLFHDALALPEPERAVDGRTGGDPAEAGTVK
jgi:hypothetical protein